MARACVYGQQLQPASSLLLAVVIHRRWSFLAGSQCVSVLCYPFAVCALCTLRAVSAWKFLYIISGISRLDCCLCLCFENACVPVPVHVGAEGNIA